jgi:hypothetical protein
MKTTNKRIGSQWWHITLLQEPEDVDDVIAKYRLNAEWAYALRRWFGKQVPEKLGICLFEANWIIVVATRSAGLTLAHELGHAHAYQNNGDKSEQGAHKAARFFLRCNKRKKGFHKDLESSLPAQNPESKGVV